MMIFANPAMKGTYDYPQVALSVLIAVAASFVALGLAGRISAERGLVRAAWLAGGATAMGTGIWSMHFVGMLAFHLPVKVDYDWPTLLASLLVAILASACALSFVSQQKTNWIRAWIGSLLIAGGMLCMHYMGMAAMRFAAVCRFDPLIVSLSVVCAVAFSFAALLLAFGFREETRDTFPRRMASAVVMGAAISAMHFIGMASASFIPAASVPDLSHAVSVSTPGAFGIASVALLLLGLAVLWGLASQANVLERRVRNRTRQLTELNWDLTEREERLREYEKVVDGLEEMIVVVDRKYRCVLANRAFLKYRGIEREQLAGRPASEWLIPELFETVIRQKIDASLEGKAVKYELHYEDPHLGERDLFLSNVPIEGGVGIDRVACILQDVTDRKRADRATEDWQKRLELAERAGLRIGLWDWSVDAGTVVWSDETYRQFGFTRDTFSGRVDDAVVRIHPEDRSRVEEAIRRVMAEGQEYAVEYRVVRPDKTICWIDAFGVVVRDGPTHMLGIGIDVTNLKKTEQSLQQAKMELAHMTRVATMGELAASIAHQINQPLAAIVLNQSASLRWLTMQPPNLDEAREAVIRAIKEANRAGDVIVRVRALLQKAPPQIGWLDLNEIIREVLALTASELRDGAVTIDTELAADLPAARGDRVQMQQVILNLIMNAVEAMSMVPVPRKLLIKSAPHPEGVLIQIQDSGAGLCPEKVGRIFEPFFTTKPQGVGMGLSIARSVVESHGGRLWVTSGSSPGAIFQFTVPVLSP
jgi:PAS domain S-box-containing protein